MKKILKEIQSGFTLIELLVVVGILSLLAVAALVAINPAEAQKKARDAQRLKDAATIQSIIEQFLNDNPGVITLTDQDSYNAGAADNKACATGWLADALGKTVCPYANVLPVDPMNRITTTTTQTGTDVSTLPAYYYVRFSGGAYKTCTRLESKANAKKLIDDGEPTANDVFSVFSLGTIACP